MLAALLYTTGCALLLAFGPSRLFVAAREASALSHQIGLSCALIALGAIADELWSDRIHDIPVRSLCLMMLASITIVDAWLLLIPDLYTMLLGAGAIVRVLNQSPDQLNPLQALSGALLGFAILGGVALGWRRINSTEGLGLGDVKLSISLGLLLGPERLLWTISLASIGGALFGLSWSRLRKQPPSQIKLPLGAFLAAAATILMFVPA